MHADGWRPRRLRVAPFVAIVAVAAWGGSGQQAAEADSHCTTWNSSVNVVGIPTLNGNQGAIEVSVGSTRTVLTRGSLGLGTAAPGDRFGAALTTLDADVDSCVDLA